MQIALLQSVVPYTDESAEEWLRTKFEADSLLKKKKEMMEEYTSTAEAANTELEKISKEFPETLGRIQSVNAEIELLESELYEEEETSEEEAEGETSEEKAERITHEEKKARKETKKQIRKLYKSIAFLAHPDRFDKDIDPEIKEKLILLFVESVECKLEEDLDRLEEIYIEVVDLRQGLKSRAKRKRTETQQRDTLEALRAKLTRIRRDIKMLKLDLKNLHSHPAYHILMSSRNGNMQIARSLTQQTLYAVLNERNNVLMGLRERKKNKQADLDKDFSDFGFNDSI